MQYEPVFYPDYFELVIVFGILMFSAIILLALHKFITITDEYNRLKTLPIFDLYIELTRCFSAIVVCASKDNCDGAHFATRKVWLISLVLQRREYSQMEKTLAESYFENYLALFRMVDRSGDAVDYEKGWRDRWSRQAIEDRAAKIRRQRQAVYDD